MGSNDFYGYRGNITFYNKTLFNKDIYNSHDEKNKLFRKIFTTLKDEKLTTDYSKRLYQLVYIQEHLGIVYCQLARKRKSTKFKYDNFNNINVIEDEDFPFVNVLIDLKSQKFLIQRNSSVFDNFDTSINVLKKIISKYLADFDAEINFYPITKETDFYYYINNDDFKIYSVNFTLNSPNFLRGHSAAEEFAREVKELSGCEVLEMNVKNGKGGINFDKDFVNSLLEYISAGGGQWKMSYKFLDDTRRQNISSRSSGEFVKIQNDKKNKINLGSDRTYLKIRKSFNKLESFESLKNDEEE